MMLPLACVVRSVAWASSRRVVKLSRKFTEALRAHLERRLGEIDEAASRWQENGLVFAPGWVRP